MLGWNYRITEFQAAVLLAQLDRLPEQVALRNTNVAHLERRIAELEGVSTLPHDERMTTRSGYGVVLRYDERAWRGAAARPLRVGAAQGRDEAVRRVLHAGVQRAALRLEGRADRGGLQPDVVPGGREGVGARR